MSETDPIESPPRLGRYEIVKAVGAGSYALVFAAYDTVLERHVALKVLREPYATAEIQREAQALARIDHPNVIKLHEIGDADGLIFLVLDLVRGGTPPHQARSVPTSVICVELMD